MPHNRNFFFDCFLVFFVGIKIDCSSIYDQINIRCNIIRCLLIEDLRSLLFQMICYRRMVDIRSGNSEILFTRKRSILRHKKGENSNSRQTWMISCWQINTIMHHQKVQLILLWNTYNQKAEISLLSFWRKRMWH